MRAGLASRLAWSAYTLGHASMEKRIPWEDPDRLMERQNRRVRQMVRFAWEHVPFYREAMEARGLGPEDFRCAEDLSRLPLIDGSVYGEAPHRFRPHRVDPGEVLRIHSGGTTGRTKEFRYDGRSLFLSLAHGHRQRHVLAHFTGRLTGYRELNLLRDGSVSNQIRAYHEEHLWTPRRADLTRAFLAPGELPLDAEVARINEFRPDVVIGYGSYLGALYRAIGGRGLEFHRPRALVYGADSMPEADRAYIEGQLGIPVLSIYQSTESLRIGFQCELRRGLHLSVDAAAVRIADGAGRTVRPGEAGDVIISNLTNRATVLLNYRLGDVAVSGRERCPCGRTLPVLERLEGRSDDLIHLANGRTPHALQVMHRLRAASGVERIQVVQEEAGTFRVRAVSDAGLDRQAAAASLAAELAGLTGERADVSVEWVEKLPAEANGKTRVVISKVRG